MAAFCYQIYLDLNTQALQRAMRKQIVEPNKLMESIFVVFVLRVSSVHLQIADKSSSIPSVVDNYKRREKTISLTSFIFQSSYSLTKFTSLIVLRVFSDF